MLPVATPPNAIIFGSKRISVIQMAKTGFVLNLIGIVIVSVITYYFGTFLFDITEGVFPEWAQIGK
jgi:sodium-dependent dicarboxylate transporter 2/3/5